jgi:hypothetical protein
MSNDKKPTTTKQDNIAPLTNQERGTALSNESIYERGYSQRQPQVVNTLPSPDPLPKRQGK